MKLRLEFSSGIPSREVETSGTVEEFLFAEFGTRLNFENLGGRAIILAGGDPVAARYRAQTCRTHQAAGARQVL